MEYTNQTANSLGEWGQVQTPEEHSVIPSVLEMLLEAIIEKNGVISSVLGLLPEAIVEKKKNRKKKKKVSFDQSWSFCFEAIVEKKKLFFLFFFLFLKCLLL